MHVGCVAQLFRYPVKSMRGEQLSEARVDERRLRGDRAWAAYTADGGIGSGKTTRRFRRVDGLLDHRATLGNGAAPDVVLASGQRCRAGEPTTDAALSHALGRAVVLREEGEVPHHDECPVHVVTTAALRHLERLVGHPVDVRRLRPNVVLHSEELGDDWAGRELCVGEVVLRVGDGMPRCVMVDLPQPGTVTVPAILTTVGRVLGNRLGLQASVLRAGRVRLGDTAHLS